MCGISGFNWGNKEKAEQMNSCLFHRGPDASGIYLEDGITFSHNRLSIIDLSPAAGQPMLDQSGDLVIIFNGEIYNFKELRNQIGDKYKFRSLSDTEVLLAGFSLWGKSIVEKLNGIFSFAIWNKKTGELMCARDGMGVKPFFYFWDNDRFIFASEIKSILVHDVPRTLDMESFQEYMRVLYVPEPRTMITNIFKLPPGHILTLKNKRLTLEQYYKPKPKQVRWGYDEAKQAVRDTVGSAVKRQMVADVPVGVYLSGGIDSSIVLSQSVAINPQMETFSVGFDLEDKNESEKFNRDLVLAEKTAQHFGVRHNKLMISSSDVAGSLEQIIGTIDDPISNPTAIAMAHLSSFAKGKVTVVLSGNGGDELFGGYERYRMSRRVDVMSRIPGIQLFLPSKINKAIEMSALDRLAQFEFEKDFRLQKVITAKYQVSLPEIKESFRKYIVENLDKTEALMHADFSSWLPDQALALGDKMSMYGSLEERVPLLDCEIVNLAYSLPLSFKVTPFQTKKILKDAFRNVLPASLFSEPKRGWFSPGAKWLRNPEVRKVIENVLSEGYYQPTSQLFDWPSVQIVLRNHIDKQEYNLTILWAIITFQIWARTCGIKVNE
jgi:asparagine synthase (glutamine-hydrolysing)